MGVEANGEETTDVPIRFLSVCCQAPALYAL